MIRRVNLYIMILLIVIAAYSMFANMTVAKKYENLKKMYIAQKDELAVYEELVKYKDILTADDIQYLRNKGIENPEDFIKNDLMGRGDIIKSEGVKGGTMGFYDSRNIYILNSKWVYAVYEDGHIQGSMLLEYSIDNGKIKWNKIAE